MNKVYGVIFNKIDKKYYYLGEEDYEVGSLVLVNTERGLQLVKVVQILEDAETKEEMEKIERLATDEEYEAYLINLKDADKALKKCIEYAKDFELEMNVVSAQFNLDRSQLLFNFTADGRIDFRELAKKLASIYHTRIELRQIGARDKAKEIGGIGVCGGELCCLRFLRKMDTISMNMAKNQNLALNPSKINGACGRLLCCSTFLTSFSTVSINMAKNQGLALNPSKINGVCGRLLCCLAYEDEAYIEAASKLPKVGDKITTSAGEAQVLSVDIINHRGKILLNGEKIDYDFESEK